MGLMANNLNIDKVIKKVSSKIVKHGELSETEIEALIREEIND